IRQILALEIDPENVKLLAQIKDVALAVISQQIRVDEGKLRPPASGERRLVEYEAAERAYERSLLKKPSKDDGEPDPGSRIPIAGAPLIDRLVNLRDEMLGPHAAAVGGRAGRARPSALIAASTRHLTRSTQCRSRQSRRRARWYRMTAARSG